MKTLDDVIKGVEAYTKLFEKMAVLNAITVRTIV